jgi:hypothetical protein
MTFFNWTGRPISGATLVCAECGRIEWFVQEPERAG